MTKKIVLVMFIAMLLSICSSNAQKVQPDLCKILKTEIKHYIDTIKAGDTKGGRYNVYNLTILDNKVGKTEFGLGYINDVRDLYRRCDYFAIIDSDFVMIRTLEDALSTLSLIECLNANPISKNDIEKIKDKLYHGELFVFVERRKAELCIIRDGILSVDGSDW